MYSNQQILSLLLFSSIIIFLQINSIDSYETFELVNYCERFDMINYLKYPNEKDDDDILTSGMIIEPSSLSSSFEPKKSDNLKLNPLDLLNIDTDNARKTVIVDTGYDNSAIKLIVKPEHIFSARLRCSILVIPKKPNGLIVTLRKLRVRPGNDWLRISVINSSFTRTFSHIRINNERESVAYVAHHGVLIEFSTKTYLSRDEKVEIEVILTSFREADLCDIDQEFDCGSFRCISKHYVCDDYNNCGDSRDETNCPMDNITNYLIVSTTLLLVSFIIFLCICYRCCFQSTKNRQSNGAYFLQAHRNRKQYDYLRIRTNSTPPTLATPQPPLPPTIQPPLPLTKKRSQSMRSAVDLPPSSNQSSPSNPLRRFTITHGHSDSMPILVTPQTTPTTTGIVPTTNYGSIGQTPFYPAASLVHYQPYAITVTGGTNRINIRPLRRQLQRQNSLLNDEVIHEHHTFPLPQPTYPSILHPGLFQQPPPPPPPPQLPVSSTSTSTSQTTINTTNNDPPPPPYTPHDPNPK